MDMDAEYIDKQAAIDLEPPPKHLRQYQTINLDDAYESGWYDAQAVISQLPPADVRPVVRSHWKKNDNGTYSCERCHSWIPEEQRHYANWCLYCAADMRGGDADGDTKD